jgi:poly(A) polymerase
LSFNLEPSQISAGARSIVETLQRAGYTAYVVGGCVRDLILNLRPKDFDVATDATPEEVHALFRGSRMIGRRFRLVHVRKGREIIEVSTFRGLSGDQETAHNENVFGSFEEDAFRRDFTINALYFDPIGNALLDPTERGLLDITDRALTIIGDPTTRIIEDPVRMIRAARFAAKLNFRIDDSMQKAIKHNALLLQVVPPARLFEEFLKLALAGYSAETFRALEHFGLYQQLFPAPNGVHALSEFELRALVATDERIRNEQSVTPAFLLAALLWSAYDQNKQEHEAQGTASLEAAEEASEQTLIHQLRAIAIPRRFTQAMKEIWLLQDRLTFKVGRRPLRLLENKRFRAAYDFLLLRAEDAEALKHPADWWTRVQTVPIEEQRHMLKEVTNRPGKSRRRKKSKSASTTD